MATIGGEKVQYDTVATEYKSYDDLPMAALEAEMIRQALGDCTGLTILDLGGGSGTHARQAVAAGAARVDVADISAGMMQVGKDIEAAAGREGNITWHTADAGKPLAEQVGEGVLPVGGYDLVMANWVFDHAHTEEDLKGMWTNIATSLKDGGRFVGIRVIGPGIYAKHVAEGKYGAQYADIGPIPGGLEMRVVFNTEPPFAFGGTVMKDSYDMINEIPKALGMVDFESLPDKDSATIAKDPEFWKEHLAEPLFAVVKAKKAAK